VTEVHDVTLSTHLTTKLLGAIETDTLVFLCGAGLSIPSPSNLLSAVTVSRHVYDEWQPVEALDPLLRDDLDRLAGYFYGKGDFEKVFLRRVPWRDFVGVPNSGHAAIADFLICRAARSALSANFDGLIESWAGSHKVFIRGALTGQEAEQFDNVSRPLVKFHGCLQRDLERTLWTRPQLSEATIDARVKSCSEWMHVVVPGKHLVVVGFWTDWGYFNDVITAALSVAKAVSVTVIDPSTSAELEAKAPHLWTSLNSLSDVFEHVQVSADKALEDLRDAYSRAWARRFFGLGPAMMPAASGAPAVAAAAADALNGEDLYDLRRDAEGVPYTGAAQLKAPAATAAQAAMFHLELINAGATQRGAWLEFGGQSIRIVNGAGRGLATVRSEYKEPSTIAPPDIVVCAGSIDIGVPGTLIDHGRGASIMSPAGGGSARWLTLEQARAELRL
jgi:hypothetical protein